MTKELTMEKTQLDTERSRSMPDGWEMKTLGELSEVITKGTTPTSIGYKFVSEGINFIKVESISLTGDFIGEKFGYITVESHAALKRSQLKKGDILFSIAGALGRTAIVSDDILPANTNQALAIIRLKEETSFTKEYILNTLTSGYTLEQVEKFKGGAAQQNLSLGQIKSFQIPIPPLPQQKQIVATLDKAFAAIDTAKANAEQNLQNAKELFKSYLQNVFDPSTRSGQEGDDWEEKTLGDLGKPSMCKRILKEQTTSDGDIPFYKIGTFGKTPNAYITKELYEEYKNKYSFPKKGDILISASGTIGRRVVYDGEPGFFQDSNIVWIDNDETKVLNQYLYSFYGFCDWQPSKGATISRLYNANLKQIKITFPKLLEEQKKVIKKIDALSTETKKLEAIYTQKIADLEEMKKSILQKAFSGELSLKVALAV
jgi:type I restriction enzyme S subunit